MTLLEEIQLGGFDLANRDDGAIAAALSVGRTKIVPRLGGIGVPLVVTATSRVAGDLSQTISTVSGTTTVSAA